MKKHYFALIFISSVALGWLSRGSVSATNPPQIFKTSRTRTEQKTETAGTNNVREAEFLAFAKRVSTHDYSENDAFAKNLVPKDRGALIKTLLVEGDPSGLSHEGSAMIDSILHTWVADDFEGAWDWSKQITDDTFRRFIAGEILDQVIWKDPARAMALHLEMKATDSKFQSSVPGIALQAAGRKSASEFLDVLSKIPLHGGGSTRPDFARDFDFQQAAAGISALLRIQNKLPDEYPRGFVGAWAERDPDAAFAWGVSESESLQFRFNEFLEGIEKQGIPGAASAWVVGKIEESESSRAFFRFHMAHAPVASLNGVVKAWANSNSSDRFLTELLLARYEDAGSHFFSTALTGMSSPQVRLEAIAQMKKAGLDFTSQAEQATDIQYQAWGLTKQQLQATVIPTVKH
jgi:hypothetical protein